MKSSDVSVLLAVVRPVSVSILATPPKTCSTKFGAAYVPSSSLKTPRQLGPHAGVPALAESGATAPATLTHSAIAAVLAAILVNIRNSFPRSNQDPDRCSMKRDRGAVRSRP